MVDFVINPEHSYLSVLENKDRGVTARFIPIGLANIGEFTHFGTSENDEEYDASYLEEDLDDNVTFSNPEPSYISDPSDTSESSEYQTQSSYLAPASVPDRSNKTGYKAFNEAYDRVLAKLPEAAKYRTLLTEIAYHESGYRPKVVNNIGAAGYFLFINGTRKLIMNELNGPKDLNSFLNNPELLIAAAVRLAQDFEKSFTKLDIDTATQKGHSMSGLISGAWLGGVGNVRKYLYYGKNATDGGTTIKARIKLGDSLTGAGFSNELTNNKLWVKQLDIKPTNIPNIGDFNVLAAIDSLHYVSKFDIKASRYNRTLWTSKNLYKSGRHCARAVSLAMEAGGLNVSGRPNSGGDYGPYLEQTGWSKLPNNTVSFRAGDICVTQGLGKAGHISMYDGRRWISDYIQDSWKVWRSALPGTNTNFYRYRG